MLTTIGGLGFESLKPRSGAAPQSRHPSLLCIASFM